MTDVHTPQSQPESAAGEDEATHPFGDTQEASAAERGTGGTAQPAAANAGWLRWGWRQLTSMRTALILLFLLALGSIPGSVLPQEGTDPASVQQYYTSHPGLAPWLNHFGLFNVFAAPWFAAIYLLLFASLVGCVVPRTFRLVGSARTPPPRAPRNLARLPQSSSYSSPLPPAAAVDGAAAVLGGKRFRLRRSAADATDHWVSAEKGYLREVGNLLFHLSLLGVLLSIAAGGLFGYKADKLVVEGQPAFSDTVAALDEFHPGRLVSGSDLPPFSLALNKFTANYIESGAVARPAVELQRERHVQVIARRQAGDLQRPDQRPALRRLAEDLPDRTRVRAGIQGHRAQRARWFTTRRPRSSRPTRARSCPTGWSRRQGPPRGPTSASWASSCRPRSRSAGRFSRSSPPPTRRRCR